MSAPGVAQQLIDLALSYAKQHDAHRINEFDIEITPAVAMSQAELRVLLTEAVRGTIAEGAKFEITRVAAHLHCTKCGNDFAQEYAGEACPVCHSARVLPKMHDEFTLVSIDID